MDNPDERARFHMLIDTCVWLDIAKDYQQQAILAALGAAAAYRDRECHRRACYEIWYNRHQVCREKIEAGEIKIVEKEIYPLRDHRDRTIQRDIWDGALKSAAKVEKKYGLENLGPWNDFEWGMINGKLSALRWVLGDEWDMLDT